MGELVVSSENCDNHNFETAEDHCGTCGRPFCQECIIYPWGPKKAPLCKACAIAAAGIRKHASRAPVANRRDLKRQARARKAEEKARRKAATTREPAISAAMDWDALDADAPLASNGELPRGGSATTAGAVAAMGGDDPVLQEVRPFDDRLSSVTT